MDLDNACNIFLIFRVFTHGKDSERNWFTHKLLDIHESLTKKNEYYKDNKDNVQLKGRRPFSHVEMIFMDKMWGGIINDGKNDKVFVKKKLNFEGKAVRNYPQVVMIKLPRKNHDRIKKFFTDRIGQSFSNKSVYLNTVSRILGIDALKWDPPKKWHCNKLIIKALNHGGLKFDLDPLTANSEDIFWECFEKKMKEESKTLPIYYVYEYKTFPEKLIL